MFPKSKMTGGGFTDAAASPRDEHDFSCQLLCHGLPSSSPPTGSLKKISFHISVIPAKRHSLPFFIESTVAKGVVKKTQPVTRRIFLGALRERLEPLDTDHRSAAPRERQRKIPKPTKQVCDGFTGFWVE